MLKIDYDLSINKLVLWTDDNTIHCYLEKTQSVWSYIPWKKSWGYTDKLVRLYQHAKRGDSHIDKATGLYKYVINPGWAGYLLGVLDNKISITDKEGILKYVIRSDNYRTQPFSELRDYQNDDVLFLLRYRRGLFQVQTGYGKSQTISVLTHYAHDILGKKVLLVCPGSKARDELAKRIMKLYGISVSCKDTEINGHLDCIITSGLKNSKKYKDPQFEAMLATYDWVLVDEVEYTINEAGEYIYDHCTGADHFYGFSGTADKTSADTITFNQGLTDVVLRNKDLIGYFGPSLVYRLPLTVKVDFVKVRTKAFDNLQISGISGNNLYNEYMNAIWLDPEVVKAVMRVCKKFPKCFIPINFLTSILDTWINNYFIGQFRVLLVCGRGYIWYDLDGSQKKLTLDEACDYIKNDMVDVIPTTASGYRALDLPGLENICLFAGKLAGVTLQCVGRVARGSHMNIITIDPVDKKKIIPVYSKGSKNRDKMIKTYYKYCANEEHEYLDLGFDIIKIK